MSGKKTHANHDPAPLTQVTKFVKGTVFYGDSKKKDTKKKPKK